MNSKRNADLRCAGPSFKGPAFSRHAQDGQHRKAAIRGNGPFIQQEIARQGVEDMGNTIAFRVVQPAHAENLIQDKTCQEFYKEIDLTPSFGCGTIAMKK